MTIRQSCFQAGLTCRRAFKHAQTHTSEPSKAMIDGLVFEGFVFGFKDDSTQYAFNKDGSEKKTVQNIKRIADLIKPLFGEGEAHKRIYSENVSGEPDFIGEFNGKKCIVDLKFTKDIAKIWNYKQNKSDYFQAVSYTYLNLYKTGELLPFYYLVVANNEYEKPIYRIIEVKVTQADIDWFLGVVKTLSNDQLLIPDTSKCLGSGRFDPPCRYIEQCEHGRELIGGTETIDFSELQCDFDVDDVVNEQGKFNELKPKQKEQTTEEDLTVEESDIDQLLETGTAKKFDSLTYLYEEWKGETLLCRSCRNRSINEGDEQCQNCHTSIKWI